MPPVSPNQMREEIKRLKLIEIQLASGIQELIETRDCLVMEVQNLQEAKPAFERAFTVRVFVVLLKKNEITYQ